MAVLLCCRHGIAACLGLSGSRGQGARDHIISHFILAAMVYGYVVRCSHRGRALAHLPAAHGGPQLGGQLLQPLPASVRRHWRRGKACSAAAASHRHQYAAIRNASRTMCTQALLRAAMFSVVHSKRVS